MKRINALNHTIMAALESLPQLGHTDGMKGDLPAVYLFTPDGPATWILWEYGDDYAFGMCDLGLGFPEMGEVYIPELLQLRGKLGLPVEVERTIKTRFEGYRNRDIPIPNWLREGSDREVDA